MSDSGSGSEPQVKKPKPNDSPERVHLEPKQKKSRDTRHSSEEQVTKSRRPRQSKSLERDEVEVSKKTRRLRPSASPEHKKSRRSRHSNSPDTEKHGKRRERRKYKDLDKPEEEYPRYYGDDKKENNDRYWSKYPKRDENVVGTRYYDVEEAEKEKPIEDKSVIPARQRKTVDLLTSKTGGAYIPPAKLRLMQAEITDKSSAAYQRIAWEALKKSIHGHINKINTSNLAILSRELLHENIVRGRGLLCKSIIQAQAASPTFTNVYAALVAVINSKFPNIGELLLKRLVLQFKRGFKQNNKVTCISAATFIAHLVNQCVAHEILALEILTLLVESPTDDSVEVAIAFLKECGQKLTEVSSKGINAIFEMLRNILHEGQLEKRIQYMIEVMFQVRKDGFKDHAAVVEELDVVDEENQFTHLITLDDVKQNNSEDVLNVFKFDDNYEENEGKYKALSKDILDTDSSGSDGSGESGSEEDSDEEGEENEEQKTAGTIIDNTETNLIILRRLIYLTIQSSLDFEECAHKLMKMELKPGQEIELCHMFLDCCAEQRTYEKFYGLLAQRFCQINKVYVGPFEQIFKDTYATTHRLDANRLRNVSKFFGHLLFTDAIGWEVMEAIRLNEQDTNSSSRIFIKILFQELAEYMGLGKLNARLKDPSMQGAFSGLFPRDNPKNTRFAINFFTTIGLGGLTDELREHLTAMPKVTEVTEVKDSSESSSSSSSTDTDSSSSSSSSSSDSSSSEDEKSKKKKKQKNKTKKVVEKNRDLGGKKKDDVSKEDMYRKNEEQRYRKDDEQRYRKNEEERYRKHEEEKHRKNEEDRYRRNEEGYGKNEEGGYRKNDEDRYRKKEGKYRKSEADKYMKGDEERVRKKNEDVFKGNKSSDYRPREEDEDEEPRDRRRRREDEERTKDRHRSSRHENRREEKVDRRHDRRRS